MLKEEPRYAVIGDPIGHSLSPRIFGWLFRELGLPGRYEAVHVRPSELEATFARLRAGDWRGISITLPHKETALKLVDGLDPLAARIGAINCVLRGDDHRLTGFNTDAHGFRRALEEQGGRLEGARVVLLGAGGAARSAAVAAEAARARTLVIANRSVDRAKKLAAELKTLAATAVPLDASLQAALDPADVLVNATSVGLSAPADSPLPEAMRIRPGLVVMDMVYRPLETALLKRARAAGAIVIDGLWMLVHQALEQLRIWTGRALAPEQIGRLHSFAKEIA